MSDSLPDGETQALHPDVRQLVKAFELAGGNDRVALTQEALDGWREKLSRLGPTERKARAEELVAVAVKFSRLAPVASKAAVLQLAELATALLGSATQARDLFATAGVNPQLGSVLGASPGSAVPVGSVAPPPGSVKAGLLARRPGRR